MQPTLGSEMTNCPGFHCATEIQFALNVRAGVNPVALGNAVYVALTTSSFQVLQSPLVSLASSPCLLCTLCCLMLVLEWPCALASTPRPWAMPSMWPSTPLWPGRASQLCSLTVDERTRPGQAPDLAVRAGCAAGGRPIVLEHRDALPALRGPGIHPGRAPHLDSPCANARIKLRGPRELIVCAQDVLLAGAPSFSGTVMPYLLSVGLASSLGVPLTFAAPVPSPAPVSPQNLPPSGFSSGAPAPPPPPPSPPCEAPALPYTASRMRTHARARTHVQALAHTHAHTDTSPTLHCRLLPPGAVRAR